MSFDDLLPILLVAFFVVNAFLRGGRRGRGRGGRPGRPGSGRSQTGRTPPGTAPADDEPASLEDELARRLEEARRRVREAQGRAPGEASGGSQAARTPEPPTSSSRPSAPAPAPATASTSSTTSTVAPAQVPRSAPAPIGSFLGREGAAGRPSGAPDDSGLLGREGPRPRPKPTARDAANRTAGARPARLPAAVDGAFDPDDIVRGMIWREVLGPPLASRSWRRSASRRRSR